MKVLILANNLRPDNGWGRYSSAVVNELKKRPGIEFLVLTEAGGKQFEGEKNILAPAKSVVGVLKNIIIVRKLAKAFDTVHAFDGFPYGIYGYLAVLGTGKKLFINGVGTYSAAPFNNFFKAIFLRLAYKKASKIFCISNYTKKMILQRVKCNCQTVWLGAPEIKKSEYDEMSLRKKYNIKDNFPIFITVGWINPRKGQLISLQAVAKIKSQYPNFRYFIIGDNSVFSDYLAEMKNFIAKNNLEKNVAILGQVSDEELTFFYEICNYFIMTSVNGATGHFEGFGLVFLEAYQFGKPGIGSRDCGVEDAILEGQTGYLARQGDVLDIYDKIMMLLKRDRAEMRKNCLEFVKKFSWKKTVDEYVRHYNS